MDKDITNMFKEKNKEIFKNSLTLEMERNLETLKSTTDNCVALEINKLFLFFKSYFQEINVDYKKEELLGILYKERKVINDIVNSKIEEKKNRIKENFLNQNDSSDVLTKEYLDNYFEKLKDETSKINDELDLLLKEEICTKFSQYIISKFKLKDLSNLERINSRINILFKDNIITRVSEQINFRDESLKNLAYESYDKYLSLNKTTVE